MSHSLRILKNRFLHVVKDGSIYLPAASQTPNCLLKKRTINKNQKINDFNQPPKMRLIITPFSCNITSIYNLKWMIKYHNIALTKDDWATHTLERYWHFRRQNQQSSGFRNFINLITAKKLRQSHTLILGGGHSCLEVAGASAPSQAISPPAFLRKVTRESAWKVYGIPFSADVCKAKLFSADKVVSQRIDEEATISKARGQRSSSFIVFKSHIKKADMAEMKRFTLVDRIGFSRCHKWSITWSQKAKSGFVDARA